MPLTYLILLVLNFLHTVDSNYHQEDTQYITMTDERDGEVYKIIGIGNQIWMAENLRYNAIESIYNEDNPSSKYGRLYDGPTSDTICPQGWHLPSDAEWTELELCLGMDSVYADRTYWRSEHGTKLKSTPGWLNDGNGTNSSGFNALPAGLFFPGTLELDGLGGTVGYRSSVTDGKSWQRFLAAPKLGVNRFADDRADKLACRCVKR